MPSWTATCLGKSLKYAVLPKHSSRNWLGLTTPKFLSTVLCNRILLPNLQGPKINASAMFLLWIILKHNSIVGAVVVSQDFSFLFFFEWPKGMFALADSIYTPSSLLHGLTECTGPSACWCASEGANRGRKLTGRGGLRSLLHQHQISLRDHWHSIIVLDFLFALGSSLSFFLFLS